MSLCPVVLRRDIGGHVFHAQGVPMSSPAFPLASVAAAALAILAWAPPALAQDHANHGGQGALAAPAATGRFTPDATLSNEMAEIRSALAERLSAIQTGKLDDADYAALGAALEGRITTIVRECRLPPDADAVLHVTIARMLTAASTMKRGGSTPEQRRDAAVAAVRAYDDYGARFDDPRWKALQTR